MAEKKISQLPSAAFPLSGSELIEVSQQLDILRSRKVKLNQIPHNTFTGLQGGIPSAGEFYHLSQAISDGLFSASPSIGLGQEPGVVGSPTYFQVDYGNNAMLGYLDGDAYFTMDVNTQRFGDIGGSRYLRLQANDGEDPAYTRFIHEGATVFSITGDTSTPDVYIGNTSNRLFLSLSTGVNSLYAGGVKQLEITSNLATLGLGTDTRITATQDANSIAGYVGNAQVMQLDPNYARLGDIAGGDYHEMYQGGGEDPTWFRVLMGGSEYLRVDTNSHLYRVGVNGWTVRAFGSTQQRMVFNPSGKTFFTYFDNTAFFQINGNTGFVQMGDTADNLTINKASGLLSGYLNSQEYIRIDEQNQQWRIGSGAAGVTTLSGTPTTFGFQLSGHGGIMALLMGSHGSPELLFEAGGNDPIITHYAGSPENNVTAPPGSLCMNTNGGSNVSLYVKESGIGNTGWVAK